MAVERETGGAVPLGERSVASEGRCRPRSGDGGPQKWVFATPEANAVSQTGRANDWARVGP